MNTIDIPAWAALLASILLICGAVLTLIGSIGLLRLSGFYARVHTPTLGTTLGIGCVLLASMLISSMLVNRPVLHEVLIMLFCILTSPVTTMILMRAAIYRDGTSL